VVEGPTGGAHMANEILSLRIGGVESEPERSTLHGVGHRHSPVSGCRLRVRKLAGVSRLF
jgi:hypothetical protein